MTTDVTGGEAAPAGARGVLGRRQLLVGAGAALLAVGFSPPGRDVLGRLPFVGSARAPFDRTPLTEHVGEVFRAVETGTIIVLDRVESLPHTVDEQLQFAAVFTVRRGAELTADTHRFVSDTFGELPLFVSPMIDGAGATTGYRAIVDRFVPADAAPPPTRTREGGR